MLEYKLKMYGIRLEKQKESYSSQCSPVSPEVSKKYAEPSNRKKRGLYVAGKKKLLSVTGLKQPQIIKVAA